MKNNLCKSVAVLILFLCPVVLLAQDLKQRGLVLKADYPLISNGVDLTGNYGPMSYGNHVFEDSSILSKGCRLNDTCLIETPPIDAMNDQAFAFRIEFKIKSYGGAIMQAGKGYRYLGLATTGAGKFGMKTGSQKEEIFATSLNLNEWYSATAIHNTADSVTEVYLNDKLITTKKQYLDHPIDDNVISNIDFSRGYAFSGHLRNFKVYSTDELLPSSNEEIQFQAFNISPNPATTYLRIDVPLKSTITYTISDIRGSIIDDSAYNQSAIKIDELQPGMYLLSVYEDGFLLNRGKFIKR